MRPSPSGFVTFLRRGGESLWRGGERLCARGKARWHAARRQWIGRWGERRASRHLRRAGLVHVARNARRGREEIDLVLLDRDGTLVFVEVKTRGPGSWHRALDKIDRRKILALRRACRSYVAALGWSVPAFRLDVVLVDYRRSLGLLRLHEVTWYENVVDLG